ncbi:MAG: CapA family protein [Lentisphaeria bacterium]|nr:CapA family protein [Lentisphaeria bacterium]
MDWTALRAGDPDAAGSRKLIFAADWAPIRRFESVMADDPAGCYGDVLPLLQSADLRIVNFECTLRGDGAPVRKGGPNLSAAEKHLECLKAGGFEIASLANNHIFDYGPSGFQATARALDRLSVRYFGAGMDLSEAQKPLIYDLAGLRLGFCGFTEGHDLSGAGENTPGVAPWDPDAVRRQVAELREECDLVFVIPHGGIEFSAWPAPYCIDAYRRIADARPDAIIAHHPHVPQGMEFYRGVPIFYSLGNFLFYQETRLVHRKHGFLAELSVGKDGLRGFRLHPYRITDRGVDLLPETERTAFGELLQTLSRPFEEGDPYVGYHGMLKERWQSGYAAGEFRKAAGFFDSDPIKAAALFRNRMTTLQHTQLWIPMFDRVVRGRIGDAPDRYTEMEHEFMNKES